MDAQPTVSDILGEAPVAASKIPAPTASDLLNGSFQPVNVIPPPGKTKTTPSALQNAYDIGSDTLRYAGKELQEAGSNVWSDLGTSPDAKTGVVEDVMAIPEATRAFLSGVAGMAGPPVAFWGAEGLKALGAPVDPAAIEERVAGAVSYTPPGKLGQEITNAAFLPAIATNATGDVIQKNLLDMNPNKPSLAFIAGQLPNAMMFLWPSKSVAARMATARAAREAAPAVKGVVMAKDIADKPKPEAEIPEPPEVKPEESVDKILGQDNPVVEARVNTKARESIDELVRTNPEAAIAQIKKERLAARTDKLTGMQNATALEEADIPPKSFIAYVDADSLKFYNDHVSYDAGDELLRNLGAGLQDEFKDKSYRVQGDEFVVGPFDSPQELNARLKTVATKLEAGEKLPGGGSPRFTWAVSEAGDTPETRFTGAQKAEQAMKLLRESTGKRAARGVAPPDFKGVNFEKLKAEAVAAASKFDFSELTKLDDLDQAKGRTSSPPPKEKIGENAELPRFRNQVWASKVKAAAQLGYMFGKTYYDQYWNRLHTITDAGFDNLGPWVTSTWGDGDQTTHRTAAFLEIGSGRPISLRYLTAAEMDESRKKGHTLPSGPEIAALPAPGKFADMDEDLSVPEAATAPPAKEKIGEPEAEKTEVTPSATYTREYFDQQVERIRKQRLSATQKMYGDIKREFRRLFPDKTGENEGRVALLSQVLVAARRDLQGFETMIRNGRKLVSRLNPTDRLMFIHELSHPEGTILPELRPQIRAITNAMFKAERAVKIDVQAIENYMTQYWERPNPKMAEWLTKRAEDIKAGRAGFQMHKHWKDMGEGLDHDGIPLSDNAYDILLMRKMASVRMIAQMQALDLIEKYHMLEKSNDSLLPGQAEVNGPDGFRYVGDENVVNLIKNGFFSNSLWSDRTLAGFAFRAGMGAKIAVVPFELGFSLYHPQNLLMYVKPANNFAESLYILEHGPLTAKRIGQFAQNMVRSLSTVEKIRFHPIGAAWDALHGEWGNPESRPVKALQDAWLGKVKPEEVSPQVARWIQMAADGGYSPVPTAEYLGTTLEAARKAWEDRRLGALAGHSIVLTGRLISAPIVQHLVPYIGTQQYLTQVERLMRDDPSLEEPGLKRTLALSRARRNTYLRTGQVPYDLEFWNKAASGALQAGFLSFTWFRNWVDQFPGGALDAMRLITKHMSKEKAARYRSSRLEFAVMYTAMGAFTAAVVQKAATGMNPRSLLDLIDPVWHVDKDGTEHRIGLPNYNHWWYDAYVLSKSEGPVSAVTKIMSYKGDPIIGMIREQLTNRNFYNQEISDPDSNWLDQFGERAKAQFLDMRPIPFQSVESQDDWLQNEPPKIRIGAKLLAFAGNNPPAKYVTRAPLVSTIYNLFDKYDASLTPYERVQEGNDRHELRALYKQAKTSGNMDAFNAGFTALAQKYQWTEGAIRDFAKSLDEPEGAYEFSQLPPHVQLDLLKNEMTPDQAQVYLPLASIKARMAYEGQ